MLWRLLKTYLAPYWRLILVVVVLQLFGNIASLYLPAINGEIIDRGVATGDTVFILSRGGVMLATAGFQIACSSNARLESQRPMSRSSWRSCRRDRAGQTTS